MQEGTAYVAPQVVEYRHGSSHSQSGLSRSQHGAGYPESAFAATGAYGHSDARFDGRNSNGGIAQYVAPPAISSHRVSAGGSSHGRISGGGALQNYGPTVPMRMQSTAGLYNSSAPSDQASASDGFTHGWMTMDGHVITTAAPDLKGRLDNALDNLAVSGAPFLNRFVMLSAAHRRSGGQGVVQVRC